MPKQKSTRINFEYPEESRRKVKELASRKGTTVKLIGIKLFDRWIKKNEGIAKLIWWR